MTATNKEMSTEFQYFGDVWTFFKKYYHVRPDDDYWEAVVEESSAIVQKYNICHCVKIWFWRSLAS